MSNLNTELIAQRSRVAILTIPLGRTSESDQFVEEMLASGTDCSDFEVLYLLFDESDWKEEMERAFNLIGTTSAAPPKLYILSEMSMHKIELALDYRDPKEAFCLNVVDFWEDRGGEVIPLQARFDYCQEKQSNGDI
jgi:hypothetical protein